MAFQIILDAFVQGRGSRRRGRRGWAERFLPSMVVALACASTSCSGVVGLEHRHDGNDKGAAGKTSGELQPAPLGQLAPAGDDGAASPLADAQAATASSSGSGELRVGASVAGYLKPLMRRSYAADELEALYTTLDRMSAPLCEHQRRDAKRDAKAISAYLHDPAPFFSWGVRSKYGAISGCWNFLEMNDRRPDRDFLLAQRLFPADEYECASVGAMQPYLMANVLPCRRMTMVDIDWRIHEFHHHVDALASAGRLDDEASVDLAVREISSAWLAERKPTPRERLSLRELCPDSMLKECGQAMRAWAQRGRSGDQDPYATRARFGERLDLLSSLHDADFDFGAPGSRSVLYLSNALEPSYTNREQARELFAQLGEKLVEGRRAVIIHHAGGKEAFGLYEVWRDKDDEELQIKTLCRDPYPIVSRTVREGVYWIALDRRNAGAPHCAALYRRHVEARHRVERASP